MQSKPQLINLASYALIFFVGFGVGRFDQQRLLNRPSTEKYSKPAQVNQATTTTAQNTESKQAEGVKTESEQQVLGVTTNTATTPTLGGSCPVKGNISTKEKIYHVKGGMFYDRVKEEFCFNTEDEAVKAGFRKSTR